MAKQSKPDKPRTPLSKERVFSAAIALADAEGLDALVMRRVGQELGVEAMSLYKHVANKEELLDGIVDIVIAEIEPPAIGGDWKTAMRRRAHSAHEVLMRHPWVTMLILQRAPVGPAMLNYVNATIGCLVEAGFSYPLADQAWNALDNHIYGFTLQRLNFPYSPDEYAAIAKQFLPGLPRDVFPFMWGMANEVIEGRHDGIPHFDFGLELILDGLERLLAKQR